MESWTECKANFAGCVKGILPPRFDRTLEGPHGIPYILAIFFLCFSCGGRILLDDLSMCGIIHLTDAQYGVPHDSSKTVGPKDRSVEESRMPASPSRTGQRSTLRARGLFRSARLGSGQVRNGPPLARRRRFRCCLRQCLWVLTSVVLSSSSSVAACRHSRPGASQTRTAKCTQVVRRDSRVSAGTTYAVSWRYFQRPSRDGPAALWQESPSSQCRAGNSSAKKTVVGSAHSVATVDPGEIAETYEALRADALACRLSTDRRGLALLTREGLAAWSTSDVCHRREQTSHASSGGKSPPVGINETTGPLIAVLASMALASLREVLS